MNALEIKRLTKTYPGFTLDDLNLTLPSGCIMGLIGENGAGKSTTIKLILDMIHKDSGSITILGKDNSDSIELTKEDIGVVMDEVGIPECLTVKQVGNVMKHTFRNWNEAEYARLVQKLALPDKKQFKELSRGMKMKLGITAESEGITGTSYKKRDEFNRMIRRCKQGKIDMIIVKSIARFARNTVDCLKFVRMLNDLGVVVYFEEQGIYTNQPGAEFYITIYGCIAQSESENISANVKWGKARSAKEGNVPFHYKNFLGYRKGADGKPEIDPEEAETVRFIYERFLAGDSLGGIAQKLEDMQIPSPKGKAVWSMTTIQSILSNEKYKGDAVINKTYIKDCLSKKVMVNNGERPKYYIENNHPAIIDAVTFGRVQEELARRAGKPKTKKVGTKTEQGKYSSKYAMTELLVCGECKTPYRRCTWTVKGQKKIVWRCINRLDFGKKYCHNSPTVEESILQRAVMRAIMETAQQNLGVLQTLKVHIGMALENEPTEDNSMELQIRIAEIDAEFKAMLSKISTETVDAFDEEKAKRLMDEKVALQQQLAAIQDGQLKREQTKTRLDDIYTILDGLKNRPMEYDEQIVRQLLECITVDSKEQITVIFVGGLKVVQPLID